MEILQNLHAEGHTIVMITHDARNAAYAERIIHLQDGKIDEDNNHVISPALAAAGGLI
jgi:macrolide transport system ATP-binding/permease protein